MPEYTSLIELSADLMVGEYVAWIGERNEEHAGDRMHPNRVTAIEEVDNGIRVHGTGPRGGTFYYTAHTDGSSEAVFVHPDEGDLPQGEVACAIWTDSEDPVPVTGGVHDVRDR